ncbi:NAD(P)/FAD-dependent oxidoreductase [Pseudomonas gingeri]|uniref:FAD-binding oxidoreductase n=1 Tax=Pseudomonas gingeri TaxID=117681 RepID=A0A7Y7YD31_9PSED|nr:FAD-dependent oxidoreductase [Pseudomonas gingeri]NWA02357.1 FAD-binding oxidoreductase [Pseudomonas gingeri]NWA12470.1 FAD-binding oxidoreductase [Pseudomonas gingeri]NWA57124.1 FAD-binding oxidoreductase [Pseudomonas gingeri]NWA93467.1 FAD-binding oxidoreductase [Pseudomonas gingeri]NWB02939.1 FAD-binding oxidoreductase [Pseudomonas gingeri]
MSGETIVVGGGLVGLSVAYGLAREGQSVRLLDQGDVAWRAARGNFGLVWVQGKGYGMPAYARWTLGSAAAWPRLAQDLLAETGINVQLHQPGGFLLCLEAAELDEESRRLHWLREALEGDYPFERLTPAELRRRLPGVGPDVVGACYCPADGHVNPLLLLRALTMAVQRRGVVLQTGCDVERIERHGEGYRVTGAGESWLGDRVVLAAGLGNQALAAQVGLNVKVTPNRGQILVTERLAPFLYHPTNYVRQTAEGSVQLGDSHEAAGLNDSISAGVVASVAQRAVSCFPRLAGVQLVRAWGALRVLSEDGFPIYRQSRECPGVFAVTCHSGVTLAAAHAFQLAPWIAGAAPPADLDAFSDQRFQQVFREAGHGR